MNNENVEAVKEERFIPFEPQYQMIKERPNDIWFEYELRIKKVINSLSYYKNFESDELLQQSYLYFIELCKIYDPYYLGNFFPFDKFLFRNLITKLRSYIQRYYFKSKREQPTEFADYSLGSTKNDIVEKEEQIYIDYLYSLITERQQQIIDLSLKGYKQQEIGDLLGVSQSRISVIRRRALDRLNDILENNENPKVSRRKRTTK